MSKETIHYRCGHTGIANLIHLGLTVSEKSRRIADFVSTNEITSVVMLSPAKFYFRPDGVEKFESIDWPEIIMYRTFYRLLQEINNRTLIVVNECLRTQNRHDLTYNCMRHFMTQTPHVLVFQWLPLIDEMQDFMTLFDFSTGSKWKRERFDVDIIAEHCRVEIVRRAPQFMAVNVEADAKTRDAYVKEREKLFDGIGAKDPHTIPRNLHLLSGKAKLQRIDDDQWYVGRNNRFKIEAMQIFKEDTYPRAPYVLFEYPHNFLDMADFLAISEQTEVRAMVSDLPVDQWYFDRYAQWANRINDGYSSLSAWANRR